MMLADVSSASSSSVGIGSRVPPQKEASISGVKPSTGGQEHVTREGDTEALPGNPTEGTVLGESGTHGNTSAYTDVSTPEANPG